jgi:hypothetical protein
VPVEEGLMVRQFLCSAFVCALLAPAALAQQGSETAATPPVEATPEDCQLAQAPGRLIITMPQEPKLPTCAERNTCTKQVADLHNSQIMTYNRNMQKINEATADYVAKLNEYTRAAGRYASCEIDRLNSQVVN